VTLDIKNIFFKKEKKIVNSSNKFGNE